MTNAIPRADYAVVGGSATLGCRLPEDLDLPGVTLLERDLRFDTPFGRTQPFKLIRLEASHTAEGKERLVLAVRIHGWATGENWATSPGQQQVFWVLEQAGVRKITGNAGVGAMNPLLDPGDLVLVDDFLDQTHHKPSALHEGWPNSVNMLNPFCPALKAGMARSADPLFRRVFQRGVVAVVEGPWLEGVAQVRMLRNAGADLVCNSTVPEVHFAREIGACYAAALLVVDHANGVAGGFDRDTMVRTYRDGARPTARIMLEALQLAGEEPCACQTYRRPIPLNWEEPAG